MAKYFSDSVDQLSDNPGRGAVNQGKGFFSWCKYFDAYGVEFQTHKVEVTLTFPDFLI